MLIVFFDVQVDGNYVPLSFISITYQIYDDINS